MKINYHLKTVNSLLKSYLIKSKITDKLHQLDLINNLIYKFLPNEISKNCTVGNLRDSVLVLVTNSPAWKYKLTFLKQDLLKYLRESSPLLAGIGSISITIDYLKEEVNQYHFTPAKISYSFNKKKNFTVSNKTALFVNEIIEQEIQDQNLKMVFKKLIEKIKE